MQPLEILSAIRGWHWVAFSLAVLAADYVTGPFVQFVILFTIPVTLATLLHGPRIGLLVAAGLPLVRLVFFFQWNERVAWGIEVFDVAVDIVVLAGLAVLVHRIDRQRRRIQVLEGMLPICSYCKRIREQGGAWRQVESYIAEHSAAQFSHTFCEECASRHYPGLLGR